MLDDFTTSLWARQQLQQSVLALRQERADRGHVHVRFPARREELAFLFLGVMTDILAEHLDTRVVERVGRTCGADLGDELLDGAMLDLRLASRSALTSAFRAAG